MPSEWKPTFNKNKINGEIFQCKATNAFSLALFLYNKISSTLKIFILLLLFGYDLHCKYGVVLTWPMPTKPVCTHVQTERGFFQNPLGISTPPIKYRNAFFLVKIQCISLQIREKKEEFFPKLDFKSSSCFPPFLFYLSPT